ncbi:MAG: serine/threonine protein phosphatase [Gemmataceae bacterium]|nr:serine/threonine protein phosphatase [Gemmataceae bacterium]
MTRILAIGDIHGCTRAFDTLLAAVAPTPDDLIVTLGDYVDRGPDSRGAIDRVLALKKSHRLVAIRGNHDLMMMEARHSDDARREWVRCGGGAALASYAQPGDVGTLADVPADHWHFFDRELVDWYEIDTHFFVHGTVYADEPLTDQPTYMLHWEQCLRSQRPHVSGKIMVCGHTSQKSGVPLNLGHAVCIDTWVYATGWLTCLEVKSERVWQANQAGELRTARLDEISPCV